MEVDRPYTQKTEINYETSSDMEPEGQEEERLTENHLEKNHRPGDEGRRAVMATTGAEGPRPERMEELHRWPMFLRELKGLI